MAYAKNAAIVNKFNEWAPSPSQATSGSHLHCFLFPPAGECLHLWCSLHTVCIIFRRGLCSEGTLLKLIIREAVTWWIQHIGRGLNVSTTTSWIVVRFCIYETQSLKHSHFVSSLTFIKLYFYSSILICTVSKMCLPYQPVLYFVVCSDNWMLVC